MTSYLSDIIDDPAFHRALSLSVIALAPVVLLILLFVQPPTYGKLSNDNKATTTTTRNSKLNWTFGPSLPAKWCWMIFESPNWIISLALNLRQSNLAWPNRLLLGWFVFHYLHRSILYPLKMPSNSKFPLGIMLIAAPYCIVNGFLQAQDLCQFRTYPPHHVLSVNFILGMMVAMTGFGITHHADATLVQLKKSTGTYQIPYGGMFRWVSCPHFFGEILEWTGFCIASNGSLATLSFVIWTACNLIPRALAQHEWYHAKFPEDYKQLGRKAVIPLLL